MVLFPFLLFSKDVFAQNDSNCDEIKFKLSVVRVNDERFAAVTDENLEIILKASTEMLKNKFGVQNIEFEDKGSISLKYFFKANQDTVNGQINWIDEKRFNMYREDDIWRFESKMDSYLRNWSLDELKTYVSDSKNINTYADLIKRVIEVYLSKTEEIKSIKLNDKELLFDEKNIQYYSFVYWQILMWLQEDYDVVITNTPILNDDLSEPAIHSLLGRSVIGGSAIHNRTRKYGRVVFWSLFKSMTNIKPFAKFYSLYPSRTIYEANGGYGLAHEMGHMLFYIPDFYDEPDGCLMNNSSKIFDYVQGQKKLKKHKKSCYREMIYVESRLQVLRGDCYMKDKQFDMAVKEYVAAINEMPGMLNEAPWGYLSKTYKKAAKCYKELGQKEMADKYEKMGENYKSQK